MRKTEQQALIPQEATPDLLIDLIGKTQQITKAAAGVLKACRTCMDTRTKKEYIEKWGGIHTVTSRSASSMQGWRWRPCARNRPAAVR